jgi:hypothetical protein
MGLCLVAAVPSSKGGYAYGSGLNATVTFACPRFSRPRPRRLMPAYL